MKTLFNVILSGIIALSFAACTTSNSDNLIYNEGTGEYQTQEEFDAWMGRSAERDKENMEISKGIMDSVTEDSKHPAEYLELWIDKRVGAYPAIVYTEDMDGEEIAAIMKKYGGNYKSGRVRVVFYDYNGRDYFQAFREDIYWDREYEKFISGWQGGSRPSGYETSGEFNEKYPNGGTLIIGAESSKVHGGPNGLYYDRAYYYTGSRANFPALQEIGDRLNKVEPTDKVYKVSADHPYDDPMIKKRVEKKWSEAELVK